MIYDVVLFTRDWGFSPATSGCPSASGTATRTTSSLVHGHHVASLMPDAEVYERPGENHLGALAVLDEVLDVLLGLWPDAPAPCRRPPPSRRRRRPPKGAGQDEGRQRSPDREAGGEEGHGEEGARQKVAR